ncbi:MAG TPA: DUF6584 family protein [Ktedonobacteraceae bacterium]
MAQTTLREYLQKTEDAISAGRIDEAMARCQNLLIYFPDALEAQRLLGEVYMAQGNLAEAQQTFDWILTNDPENVIVYCDRALMSERILDIETALDCYQQAYELSRANPQIRQEFNKLSASSGQSDFMFSRAGLARLYMRGDLLIQAIQEWEAVLANTPGRLDARTGLLEAYWREGLYDQVEQLATQILDEIPGCVKALLLLAYVTSAHNHHKAQTLLQQAETLDPELSMAQTLFSDLTANYPNDPFLTLLKKEPIILPDVGDGHMAPIVASPIASTVEANGSLSPVSASDPHSGWGNMESWSELDTLAVSQHGSPVVQESSASATWSGNNIQNADQWATMNAAAPDRTQMESWQEPQEFVADVDPAILEQQPWYQAEQDQYTVPPEAANTWDNLDTINYSEPMAADTWKSNIQESDLPTPPAWLDMLTRSDHTLTGGEVPSSSTSSSNRQQQAENASSTHQQLEPEVNASQVTWEKEEAAAPAEQVEDPAFFFSSEDQDDDLGWPEWLKSLGAATMEETQPEEATPPAPEPEHTPVLDEYLFPQNQVALSNRPEPEHTPVLDEYPDKAIEHTLSEEEKLTMLTLENLEQDLRSQGFVPLEPGTLSSIAQEPAEEERTLSSALAQLASFAPQTQAVEPGVPTESAGQFESPAPEQSVGPDQTVSNKQPQSAEPLWAAQEQPELQPSYPAETPLQLPFERPQNPVLEPVADFNSGKTEERLLPAYRADSLLEDELETTMKRPAIRLQPMQQTATRADASHMSNRGRSGERGAGSWVPDNNLSSKERLLKGYQYQLAGSYDDAMQEYRIIIRNAPELLGEVVSNLRALLRLAPKYSAGYRVLGDAYMRQGEYLHAMEAYNKALTMAKKARSQGN